MNGKNLRICFFQAYRTDYIRAQTLLKGLRENNIEVNTCMVNERGFLKYPKAIWKFMYEVKKSNIVLANWRVYEDLWILRMLTRKPIVYDSFLSVWQAICIEKKDFKPNSIFGKILFHLDKFNCKIADHMICDTKEHAKYFCETFDVSKEKITTTYISAEPDIFYPREKKSGGDDKKTYVFWCGSGIPLQGFDMIYEAMKSVGDNIILRVAGDSEIISKCRLMAKTEGVNNIVFLGRISRDDVAQNIADSDICLGGHYSDTGKVALVIAGKAFEMVAMKKPVIVGESPAVKEIFTDGKDIIMCERMNPKSLANAIMKLAKEPVLRDKIAKGGYMTFNERLTPKKNVLPLIEAMKKLI